MKRLIVPVTVVAIIALCLSGCSRYVRQAVKVPNPDASHETVNIAVAVDYFGVKHVVRRVCSTSAPAECQIIYSTAISGVVTNIWGWDSPSGYSGMENPAIAVTDSGVAVITWETYKTPGWTHATLYVMSTVPALINEIDSGYVATSPHLVSKLNTIYALQDINQGGRWAIRYRQLVGGSAAGWVSEHGSTTNDNTYLDAAVSPSGNLHVVFWRMPFSEIMYADNYGTSGDMTNRFALVTPATNYTQPRIDVNGVPEVVYITYTNEVLPSNLLVIGHCLAASCTFGSYEIELPLDPSKSWNVIGEADIIADAGTTAYYVFNATNTDTGANIEVFEGYFQDGLAYYTANASNTAENDGTPSIGLMWSIIPVSSWVTGDDIYQFDAYPFILPYASLRLIHHTGATILTDSVNMSCNADWGAGVWIEDQATQQGYVIFNTYANMLPIIRK
jgi:hypothetical protein